MSKSDNEMVSIVALAIICIIRRGIRHEHSRRTRTLHFNSTGAWLHFGKGKPRDGSNAAPPFTRFVPEAIEDIVPFPLGAVEKYCYAPWPEFMLLGRVPTCASLSSARSFSGKPMSLNGFSSALWAKTAFVRPDAALAEVPFTSHSLRRLGPTIAGAAFLLLNARLPFGNWKADGLSKAEREAARKTQMSFLYADVDTNRAIEVAVKTAGWCLIDRLPILSGGAGVSRLSWSDLAEPLRRAMAEWRGLKLDVQKWSPTPSPPSHPARAF